MDTVVDFRNDIFTQFPERFNLYFKSPIVILKIKTMLASGYEIKAMYFGDSLDQFDWMRVYVSNPSISKNAKYFYTYEYGLVPSELGLLKFLRSIEEMFK